MPLVVRDAFGQQQMSRSRSMNRGLLRGLEVQFSAGAMRENYGRKLRLRGDNWGYWRGGLGDRFTLEVRGKATPTRASGITSDCPRLNRNGDVGAPQRGGPGQAGSPGGLRVHRAPLQLAARSYWAIPDFVSATRTGGATEARRGGHLPAPRARSGWREHPSTIECCRRSTRSRSPTATVVPNLRHNVRVAVLQRHRPTSAFATSISPWADAPVRARGSSTRARRLVIVYDWSVQQTLPPSKASAIAFAPRRGSRWTRGCLGGPTARMRWCLVRKSEECDARRDRRPGLHQRLRSPARHESFGLVRVGTSRRPRVTRAAHRRPTATARSLSTA
jgi:hypothetical protein